MQNASEISLGEKTGKRHGCDSMDVTGGLHEAVLTVVRAKLEGLRSE